MIDRLLRLQEMNKELEKLEKDLERMSKIKPIQIIVKNPSNHMVSCKEITREMDNVLSKRTKLKVYGNMLKKMIDSVK